MKRKYTILYAAAALLCLFCTGCGKKELEEAIRAEQEKAALLTAALETANQTGEALAADLEVQYQQNDALRQQLQDTIASRDSIQENTEAMKNQNQELNGALQESHLLENQLTEVLPHVVVPDVYPSILKAMFDDDDPALLEEAVILAREQVAVLKELLTIMDNLAALTEEERQEYRHLYTLLGQQNTLYQQSLDDPDTPYTAEEIRINEMRQKAIWDVLTAIGIETGNRSYGAQREKLQQHISDMEADIAYFRGIVAQQTGGKSYAQKQAAMEAELLLEKQKEIDIMEEYITNATQIIAAYDEQIDQIDKKMRMVDAQKENHTGDTATLTYMEAQQTAYGRERDMLLAGKEETVQKRDSMWAAKEKAVQEMEMCAS